MAIKMKIQIGLLVCILLLSVPALALTETDCEAEESDYSKQNCYGDLAENTGNIEYCKNETESERYVCAKKADPDVSNSELEHICDSITSDYSKQNCYGKLAVDSGNIEYCKKESESDRYKCVIAANPNVLPADLKAICDTITSDYQKQNCYGKLAEDTGDIQLCLSESESDRFSCVLKVKPDATAQELESVCDSISSDYQKQTCYGKLAENTGDTSYCYKTSESKRYSCVIESKPDAGKQEIEEICKSITSSSYKGSCYEKLEDYTPSAPRRDLQGDSDMTMIIPIVAVVLILIALLIVLLKKKSPGSASSSEIQKEETADTSDNEQEKDLEKLQREKHDIEEKLKIAKAKYYKRDLDEESFREIVKENQQKLIDIESEIHELSSKVDDIGKKMGQN
jgi:hypothetical protein